MSEQEYRTTFSKNLKYYMELFNKTQSDLVNDLKLSQSTVSNWCTGTKLPRMNKIQMLADYFGVDKSDLLNNKDIPPHSVEYLRVTNLVNIYFNGVMHWSEDKFVKEEETCVLRGHFSDLLSRYKSLIEHFCYANLRWKNERKAYIELYKNKEQYRSYSDIKTLYIKQELEHELGDLEDWIKAFPSWIARNVSDADNDNISIIDPANQSTDVAPPAEDT